MTTISRVSHDSDDDDHDEPSLNEQPSEGIKERCISDFREFSGIDNQVLSENEKQETAVIFLTQVGWDTSRAIEGYWTVYGENQLAVVKPKTENSETAGELSGTGTNGAGSSNAGHSSFDDDDGAISTVPVVKKTKTPALQVELVSSDDDSPSKKIKRSKKDLRFASYNVNGSSDDNLLIRTNAICEIINNSNPDIVFLQDVVQSVARVLESKLSNLYKLTTSEGNTLQEEKKPTFLMSLFHKTNVTLLSYRAVDHGCTDMKRKMLTAKVSLNGVKLNLVNIHLENGREKVSEEKRVNQFNQCYEFVQNCPRDEAIIIAGDLCMEDREFEELGGLPPDFLDTWIETGERQECRNTLNTNYERPSRPDRILLKNTDPPTVVPALFNLIGTKRIKQHKCYPSDHCGILCAFNIR